MPFWSAGFSNILQFAILSCEWDLSLYQRPWISMRRPRTRDLSLEIEGCMPNSRGNNELVFADNANSYRHFLVSMMASPYTLSGTTPQTTGSRSGVLSPSQAL